MIGDFHLLAASIVAWIGIGDLVGRGDPRPVGAQGMSGGDGDRTTATFLRGLTIGAIIGAILAGSSFWARWRRAGDAAAERSQPLRGQR